VDVIDERQLEVNRVALVANRSMFAGLKERLELKFQQSRTSENGEVYLS
jgi:hypothetical protein